MNHKGWHSRGYLPHFDSPGTIQFVTFRLADSLPRAVAAALAGRSLQQAEADKRLDDGYGECWLRNPAVARLVQGTILHFDGQRYRLLAWCVMPNHVHVVVEPAAGHCLGNIVQTWKSFSAKQANHLLGRDGRFWHKDYFDRYMRDDGHLARTVDYVENNPVNAGLVTDKAAWPFGSAHYRL